MPGPSPGPLVAAACTLPPAEKTLPLTPALAWLAGANRAWDSDAVGTLTPRQAVPWDSERQEGRKALATFPWDLTLST